MGRAAQIWRKCKICIRSFLWHLHSLWRWCLLKDDNFPSRPSKSFVPPLWLSSMHCNEQVAIAWSQAMNMSKVWAQKAPAAFLCHLVFFTIWCSLPSVLHQRTQQLHLLCRNDWHNDWHNDQYLLGHLASIADSLFIQITLTILKYSKLKSIICFRPVGALTREVPVAFGDHIAGVF